jgi:hypothetical protein
VRSACRSELLTTEGIEESMNARPIDQCTDECALWPRLLCAQQIDSPRQRAIPASVTKSRIWPWIFGFSLWFSSVLAIWMSRGWLALLMSGQLLSVSGWLFRNLARKTQTGLSSSAPSAFKGAPHEL